MRNCEMIVTLTWSEMMIAYQVAAQRRIMNMKKGLRGKFGAPEGDGSEELDIISTRGEMAVAKGLNLYWSGSVGDYGAVDVGGLVEVRTRTKDWHSLIIHKEDKPESPYVLVDASRQPDMRLVGWMYARDAMDEKFWSDPSGKNRPAYFVPQDALRPMDDLVSILRGTSIQKAA